MRTKTMDRVKLILSTYPNSATLKDYAQLTGMSEANVYKLCKDKLINYIPVRTPKELTPKKLQIIDVESLPGEIWKEFPGSKRTMVSNLGRIKTLYVRMWVLHHPKISNRGYYTDAIKYDVDGHFTAMTVQRIVAITWIPIPQKYLDRGLTYKDLEVNHLDDSTEGKLNNNINNLEWMSHVDNCNYGTRNQRIRTSRGLTDILQCDLQGNVIKRWSSFQEIKKENNYSISNICNCCNGKKNITMCYGYIWKYADKDEE